MTGDTTNPKDANDPAGSTAGQASASTPTERELQRLKDERDQFEEQCKRALADAANIRRRQRQEIDDVRRRTLEGITQELLPVLDNFRAALQVWDERRDQAATAEGSLVEGVRMVKSLLQGALERHGLQEIAAEGKDFDPARHEAVAMETRAGVPAGRVLRVLQAGYLLGDRVVRHARVLVSGAATDATGKTTGSTS